MLHAPGVEARSRPRPPAQVAVPGRASTTTYHPLLAYLRARYSPLLQALTLPITTAAGRLAMLGIMAFVAEQKIPGSVPALGSLGLKPYAGEVMAPFAAGNADLPYVSEMLGFTSLW